MQTPVKSKDFRNSNDFESSIIDKLTEKSPKNNDNGTTMRNLFDEASSLKSFVQTKPAEKTSPVQNTYDYLFGEIFRKKSYTDRMQTCHLDQLKTEIRFNQLNPLSIQSNRCIK